jgi:hypothetical protein
VAVAALALMMAPVAHRLGRTSSGIADLKDDGSVAVGHVVLASIVVLSLRASFMLQ